jgi:hypothetical protein
MTTARPQRTASTHGTNNNITLGVPGVFASSRLCAPVVTHHVSRFTEPPWRGICIQPDMAAWYGAVKPDGGERQNSMADTGMAVEKAKEQVAAKANDVAQSADPWIERLARLGYAVRGILYMTVGLLAFLVALGKGGATTDKHGAIATIGSQPFGKLLLVVIAVGLIGYSLWGFVRAIFDPLDRGTDPKGIAQRIGYVVSGISYGVLVIPTVRFIMGDGGAGTNSQGAEDLTAALMSQPFGVWLVGIVGLIGIAGGFGQIFQAVTADFKKDLKFHEMNGKEQEFAIRVGRFGMAARGVVFAMLGFFVFQAALQHDPKQAKGIDGALQTLVQQPYGPWLMGIVALGLVAFGIYSLLCAKWIHVTR